MAKHSTPRRRSGKHWVGTLLTAGAVVACMGLLLRFLPVGTIPTGGDEPSDSAVSSTEPAASSVPEPEPEPVVETLRFSATGDDLIHSPIYKQAARQTVNGVTIAYLSYTEHTNGIPTSSSMPANVIYTSQTDVIEQQVRAAHQQADFVIVGVHWGVEDSHTIVDGQRTLAQQLADWGADVIVGTHPHVLQDAQWLSAADGRQTFVAYSLGNFLSTQNRPDQLVGAILNLQLQKTTEPDGTVQCAVLEPKLLPTVTHYDAGKSNVRTYLFRDYTQELAKQHGVRAKHSDFSLDTVQKIAQNNISSDFLELT